MEKNTQVHQTPRSHIANAAGNSHVEDLSDIQVEAYELGGKVTGLVLWKGKSNDPFLSLKVSESGQMTPFVLESDADMPEHDDSRTLLAVIGDQYLEKAQLQRLLHGLPIVWRVGVVNLVQSPARAHAAFRAAFSRRSFSSFFNTMSRFSRER